MKKIIILLLLGAAALSVSSCGEDFLYKAPQGSIDQAALMNETGIDLLTTTAYANLTEDGWGASPFNWTFGGMYGGDANKGSDANDQSVLNDMEKYSVQSNNNYLNQKWIWIYKGAKSVNITLQSMDEVKDQLPETFMKTRKGELYFLRALLYFEGIKVFGPYIPWVDDTILEDDPKIHNDIDIYPKVLGDIDVAIANLPEKQDLAGRANSWAAKALKAKILMQKGDMASAEPILKDVIENGQTSNALKYGLEDDLNANFDSYRENGKESIFAVQFSNDLNNANTGMSLCYPHGGSGSPGGCCGFYQPSYELANSFKVDANGLPFLDNSYRNAPFVSVKNPSTEQDAPLSLNTDALVDPRLDFAIGRFGVPYKDWGLPKNNWVRDMGNGGFFMPKKHVYSKKELDADGLLYDKDIELGIMIETPAAVMMAEELAEEVDFFSVGTNDLTQYTLAIDRQNESLDEFYDSHHPGLLKMLKMIVDGAHKGGAWAGICGELGSDLSLTKEFLAMGYDELSVSPGRILPLRKVVLETNVSEYKEEKGYK